MKVKEMSVSKVNSSKFNIIRKPDYARKDVEAIAEVEISNKDSKLDNNTFSDLVMLKKQEKDKDKRKKENLEKRRHLEDAEKKDGETKNKDGITDFYA